MPATNYATSRRQCIKKARRSGPIRLDVPDLPLPTLAVDGATGAFEQQLQALVLNDRQTLVQSIQTDTA